MNLDTMGTAPLVSVVVPVYNAGKHLRRCVNSVLEQDLSDLELILVDDGSTDDSGMICDEFAASDPRVRVIHQQNLGVSCARNAALDVARGTYLQFADADDWLVPEASRLMVEAARAHACDMVVADFYRVVDKRASHKGSIDATDALSRTEYADCMMENPADYYFGSLWNKLFSRNLIERHHLRMDPELSWCEDFIFNMEYVEHADRIYPLHVPVYYYVKTKGSLVNQSMTPMRIVRMKLGVLEYYDDFFRRVYDEADYEARRGEIRRFLIEVPHDDGAPAASRATKRLGRERVRAYVTPGTLNNPLSSVYFARKLAERELGIVAEQFDMDLRDVTVLAYVHFAHGAVSPAEVADFFGMPLVSAASSISRLAAHRLVTLSANVAALLKSSDERDDSAIANALRTILSPHGEADADAVVEISLGPDAGCIVTVIEERLHEFRRSYLTGFTEDERLRLQELSGRATDNARRPFIDDPAR